MELALLVISNPLIFFAVSTNTCESLFNASISISLRTIAKFLLLATTSFVAASATMSALVIEGLEM
jgi:hypothetical protein